MSPLTSLTFIEHRARVTAWMEPRSLAVVNNNDVLPTNADGTLILHPNSDLFYLTGIEQEESVVLLFPDAHEEKNREILFIRDTSPLLEIWEGTKLTKAQASERSGIRRVEFLSSFPTIFHALMCEADNVYLNANEHSRAGTVLETTREARFVRDCQARYPLHRYHRLARILHRVRAVKSAGEIGMIRRACGLTRDGLLRVARFLRPGVNERQIEAEFAHEFISQGGRFAYSPIVASGVNACALHYIRNDMPCQDGDLVLLDVGAALGNYNSDMTRTLPVSGRFTARQRQVYDAVWNAYQACFAELKPGLLAKDWRRFAQQAIEKELVDLGLLTVEQVKSQGPDKEALAKYFMHGVGHSIGLDVHDVQLTEAPMEAGWVMTCEPAIYIREEGFGIRLEDTVLITQHGAQSLMADIPMEAEAIEELMNSPAEGVGDSEE
ncbi:MAG: M24 family metallopeptidase [Planctomycetaceae bacterium]|nr:MAG: M24 family metallopeptidase [Planctomycetaceae bacterium]